MPIKKREKSESKNKEHISTSTNNKSWSDNQLTWWVIAIWIILIVFIIFTFSKFNTLSNWDNFQIQALEKKVKNLESKITAYDKNERTIVPIYYGWWSDTYNNVSRVWEKSLWYPSAAKWKICYIIWDKIRWVEWWAIWWYLWIAWNWGRYNYSTQYEANLNNLGSKIEIIKNVWSDKNLTKTERNNLYLSLTLLCR